MKTGWIIGAGTVTLGYVTIVNVLAQRGYNAYFNIPGQYVTFSIEDNITFGDFILKSLVYSIASTPFWYFWVVVVGGLAVILYLKRLGWITASIVGLWLVIFAWNAPNLGEALAKARTNFHVLSRECELKNASSYIIPTFHGDTAVLVSIDENRRITGKFLPKRTDELGCDIDTREVGTIIR